MCISSHRSRIKPSKWFHAVRHERSRATTLSSMSLDALNCATLYTCALFIDDLRTRGLYQSDCESALHSEAFGGQVKPAIGHRPSASCMHRLSHFRVMLSVLENSWIIYICMPAQCSRLHYMIVMLLYRRQITADCVRFWRSAAIDCGMSNMFNVYTSNSLLGLLHTGPELATSN